MMGANHAITGAGAWIAATAVLPALHVNGMNIPLATGLYHQSPTVVLGGAIIAAGAALLPDADHHSATIAHSVPLAGKIVTGVVEHAAGGHRKGTHTIWAVAGVLALSFLLRFAMWDSHSWMGSVCLGAGLSAMALSAFALKVIRSVWFVRSWAQAWLLGTVIGFAVMVLIPGDQTWLPVAITVGFVVHLLGDMLTVGGIAWIYPIVPKPPLWWQASPILKHLWQKNGYAGVPVLGLTGSMREWALGGAVTLYVVWAVLLTSFAAFGMNFVSLLR